jgi:uncharacterized membrane protein YbhN (UPF0104 family)
VKALVEHPRVTTALAWARRKDVQRVARIVLIAVILFIVARILAQGWSSVTQHAWRLSWPALLFGFALLAGQELTYGFIWREILRRLGYVLPWRLCLKIYLAAEFVRYIPGNVWHVLTRVIWAEREGVPKSFGLASMTIELATKIAAAALAFAISLLWWPDVKRLSGFGSFAPLTIAIIGVPLLLVGLHPRLLRWGLNRGLRVLKRDPVDLALTYRDILEIALAWLGSWIVGGLGFWLIVWGVTPQGLSAATIPVGIGIYALGWDIGFLSFITPSGLFFREGAVALLLTLSGMTPSLAVAGVIAILGARLLPMLAEMLCVGWAYLAVRPPQPEGPGTLTDKSQMTEAAS